MVGGDELAIRGTVLVVGDGNVGGRVPAIGVVCISWRSVLEGLGREKDREPHGRVRQSGSSAAAAQLGSEVGGRGVRSSIRLLHQRELIHIGGATPRVRDGAISCSARGGGHAREFIVHGASRRRRFQRWCRHRAWVPASAVAAGGEITLRRCFLFLFRA